MAPSPSVVEWFDAAAGYLNRAALACPVHGVRHTGKLARSIVLDLALLDATGDARYWDRAALRAADVAAQLAPDPEHGAFIYLPGRLDPRNCSNSIIDSGECTDALARLLLHPRAAGLDPTRQAHLRHAVEENSGTYLCRAVAEKTITNQRLWGAMGLATAYRLVPHQSWQDAALAALERSLDEQHDDGSWGYQPGAVHEGAFAGAADLTVYYHSRCLAFLFHVADCLGALDTGHRHTCLDAALRRGLEFLAAAITPDGRKPLALEGKRWFWEGSYEVGSATYDLYTLIRGARRYGVPEWHELAGRCWAQLAQHQQANGSIHACLERGRDDFVCPDFHTADLAWPAQLMAELPPLSHGVHRGTEKGIEESCPATRLFPDAGIVRLESSSTVGLVRTHKAPLNSQFGGPLGGGALVYVGDQSMGEQRLRVDWESPVVAGNFTLYAARPDRRAALRRYLRDNPPGREGRQWLFVARLLLAHRRPRAAVRRFWRGYLRPLLYLLPDPAATHWAITSIVDLHAETGRVRITCRPARPDGLVPAWAAGVTVIREYAATGDQLQVVDRIWKDGQASERGARCARVVYIVPGAARDLQVVASEAVRHAGPSGHRVELRPSGTTFALRLTYIL